MTIQFELKLWRSVLDQVLEDAFSNAKGQSVKRREEDRADALAWLEEAGEDFQVVCELAMVEPTVVDRIYRHYLKEWKADG